MASFNFKFVRRLFPIILILAIHFMGPTSSEGASKEKIPVTLVKGQKLNQSAIHKDYQNGDFEIVLKDVADFQKLNKTYDIDDSIFIAKHLSVIYSADPATREKGKYWMHQLLNMMPSAQRLDMYVSEEIDRIFAKVQSEYIDARRSMGKPLPSEMEAQIRNEPMPSQRSAVRSAGSGKSKSEVSESKSNAAT